MSRRHISQNEARAAIKERDELLAERRTRYYACAHSTYPGTHIDTVKVTNTEWHIARTARRLKHMLVVVPHDQNETFEIFAVAAPGRT